MFSNIKSGNLLGCKRISDTSFIQWGKPYVLITQQGVMVRKLFPVNEKETTVECRTEDEDNHPPFQINLDSIFSISIILGILHGIALQFLRVKTSLFLNSNVKHSLYSK